MRAALALLFLLGHWNPYDRGDYRHWVDDDRDCQNTRAETLLLHSLKPVKYATERGCRVISGVWVDSYSGQTVFFAKRIDIDHVIPLGWAHTHGADNWSPERKKEFANDPDNLLPVSLTLNRQKGKKGPSEWRPPSNLCGYGTRWLGIAEKYDLMLTVEEFAALKEMVGHCDPLPLPYYE